MTSENGLRAQAPVVETLAMMLAMDKELVGIEAQAIISAHDH